MWSRMGNPETSATLSTQNTGHRTKSSEKNTHTTQKAENMSNTDPTEKLGVNPGAHERQAVKNPNLELIHNIFMLRVIICIIIICLIYLPPY